MRASSQNDQHTNDSNRPGLSRVFKAVIAAALSASVLLAVPAIAGAAMSDADADGTLLRLEPASAETPKVVANAGAMKPLPDRVVYRKKIATPKPSASPSPAHASSPKRASRSGGGDGWNTALVSWYGPGFYGHTMAGGGTLERDSMVVAHRSMPFGTRIMFSYKGKSVTAVVRDRGPYAGGRTFDLGPGTAKALGFSGVGTVRYRVLGR